MKYHIFIFSKTVTEFREIKKDTGIIHVLVLC